MIETKKSFKTFFTQYKFEILYWLIFVALTFLMGFKDFNVGTDSLTYKSFYENIKLGNLKIINEELEIGFCLYYFVLSKIGFSYLGAQIITALFINFSFFGQ